MASRPEADQYTWQEFPVPNPRFAAEDQPSSRRWSELHEPYFLREHHARSDPPPTAPTGGGFRPQSQYYGNDGPSSYPSEPVTPSTWAFPEPNISSPSLQSRPFSYAPPPRRHYSDNSSPFFDDDNQDAAPIQPRETSWPPSPNQFETFNTGSPQTQQSGTLLELIERFQEGDLPEEMEEWDKLCPDSIRTSLSKKEIQRQSTIFEVIKSERDYTLDLQLIDNVFVQPLLASDPPVITPRAALEDFVFEVFYNVKELVLVHERMVKSLFDRQEEEHPVINSIADIVLDAALQFQMEYELYIKHYPIAEGRHRQELKNNPAYKIFIQKCSQDTRIKKRDLITFISRPVTRLPRLALILEHVQKQTEPNHPDLDSLPITLSILSQFIKSTQPGIAAAEGKAKLVDFVEGLVYEKGEIIDLDIHDEHRTLVYQGILGRNNSRAWEPDSHGWVDLHVVLLDHYFIMTKKEEHNGVTRYNAVSRPIPLEMLVLGPFNSPSFTRRDDGEGERGILSSIRNKVKESRTVYPFTVWHATAATSRRRYTLVANSEAIREKWHSHLKDAIFLRQAQQDANKYFAMESLSDHFFRSKTVLVPSDSARRLPPGFFTGKMSSAARFVRENRNLVVIGCSIGIYVGFQSNLKAMKKALNLPNATSLAAVDEINRLLVLYDGSLLSYPLDALVKVAQSGAPLQSTSMQRLDTKDGTVLFFRVAMMDGSPTIVYAVRSFRQVTINVLRVGGGSLTGSGSSPTTPTLTNTRAPVTLKAYGSPFYVPKDASEATILKKTIAIAADHSLVIVDPLKSSSDKAITVPDFATLDGPTNALKSRCQNNLPLGIVRSGERELMVVYDTFGCYVTKHGIPARQAHYVRWEGKAVAWAIRLPYILLFNSDFIEVRFVPTGRLIQVITAKDIRFLQTASSEKGPLLIAVKGEGDDKNGVTDKLVDITETKPIGGGPDEVFLDSQWAEWED